jgi:hypothetical protein
VITEPVRIFAPGFGAGAVAGYSVMRIDPAVVAMAGDAPDRGSRAGTQAPRLRASRRPTMCRWPSADRGL